MAYYLSTLPNAPDQYGYSCQVWIAVEIGTQLFQTTGKYAWFSLQFNPHDNVDSSNPCVGYYVPLSRAIQQNDIGNRLIRDYQTQLLSYIDDKESAGDITNIEADDYRRAVLSAPISNYRPEIWRLDLQQIALRKYGNTDLARLKDELRDNASDYVVRHPPQALQVDEYLIYDLLPDEYEPIVIG